MDPRNDKFTFRQLPKAIINILEQRGIDEESSEEFFSSRPQLTYDPFLLANMETGVDLLLNAIDEGKHIVIYGDYDVDGITSTSLLMKVIGSLTDNVSYYIPSRLDEGYGLHKESIDRIKEAGGEFIVTVDCGSVSVDETDYAHSIGIETLVTDHHNVTEIRASGTIINPMLAEDEYPFKGLAGVGVAYKLALALSRKRDIPKSVMAEIIELVAIGTISDIMPMLDENRTIVKCGLRFMHLGCHNKGLRRLIDLAGLDYRNIKTQDVSFGIAPRINAAGRIGDASLGVKLLLAEDEDEINKYASLLMEVNQQRRELQDQAFEKSLGLAELESYNGDFMVLEVNDAHEGVLGIVAGKLREQLNRPVIIVTKSGDHYKGTGRSIETVSLFDMLDEYRDEFISFGGHSVACGFTIDGSKIAWLRERLNEDLAARYEEDNSIFDVDYHYDATIDPADITLELAEAITWLEPCGKENETPIFRIEGVKPHSWRFLKNDKKYAKFAIDDNDGRIIECLLFHDAEKYEDIVESGEPIDVLGTVEINKWKDRSRAQIIVSWITPSGKDSDGR